MNFDKMLEPLRAIAPDIAQSISYALETIEIAEEVMEEVLAAGSFNDAEAARVNDSWYLLKPERVPFIGLDLKVYRHHCRELLGRIVDGEDTRPGTLAECLIILHFNSLRHPLTEEYAYTTAWLFSQVFGDALPDFVTDALREALQRENSYLREERGRIIRELQNKAKCENRRYDAQRHAEQLEL